MIDGIRDLPPLELIQKVHKIIHRRCVEQRRELISITQGDAIDSQLRVIRNFQTLAELEKYLFYCTQDPQVWDEVGGFLKESLEVEDPLVWLSQIQGTLRDVALRRGPMDGVN